MKTAWHWQPPCSPDPCVTILDRSAPPTRPKKRVRLRARGLSKAPPSEAHWRRTLGRRLRLLLAED